MKKTYLMLGAAFMVSNAITALTAYSIAKKKSPSKNVAGELYIDHTDDDNNPSTYLNILDVDVIHGRDKVILIQTHHIRK